MTEYKVIVVGASKVGKTSLIQRFLFNEFSFDVPQTSKEERREVMVKDKPVPLLICDSPDRTDLVTRKYYEQTHAVIFVYDVTNTDSLSDAETWIKDLRIYLNEQLSHGLPVLFVGNKADLLPPDVDYMQETDEESSPRKEYATLKQAKAITEREKFHLKPVQCSARTGDGVGKVFEKIAAELAGVPIRAWRCNIL